MAITALLRMTAKDLTLRRYSGTVGQKITGLLGIEERAGCWAAIRTNHSRRDSYGPNPSELSKKAPGTNSTKKGKDAEDKSLITDDHIIVRDGLNIPWRSLTSR
jgi:hypothetical protein